MLTAPDEVPVTMDVVDSPPTHPQELTGVYADWLKYMEYMSLVCQVRSFTDYCLQFHREFAEAVQLEQSLQEAKRRYDGIARTKASSRYRTIEPGSAAYDKLASLLEEQNVEIEDTKARLRATIDKLRKLAVPLVHPPASGSESVPSDLTQEVDKIQAYLTEVKEWVETVKNDVEASAKKRVADTEALVGKVDKLEEKQGELMEYIEEMRTREWSNIEDRLSSKLSGAQADLSSVSQFVHGSLAGTY